MKDTIIAKDAKLSAMKNTIAVSQNVVHLIDEFIVIFNVVTNLQVMENDVCEPYCYYAHIYTALVKINEILCQNDKYRQYLKLLVCNNIMSSKITHSNKHSKCFTVFYF